MNDQFTIVSLDSLPQGRTDWSRLAQLTDSEIEAAIAADEDAFSPSDGELANAASYLRMVRSKTKIRPARNGRFRWFAIAADGTVIAEDRLGAMSRAKARAASLAARRGTSRAG